MKVDTVVREFKTEKQYEFNVNAFDFGYLVGLVYNDAQKYPDDKQIINLIDSLNSQWQDHMKKLEALPSLTGTQSTENENN